MIDVHLEHPAFLWLLVPALPLLAYAAWKSYALAPRRSRIASFVLRVLGLTLVVLGLARPVWRLDKPDQAVVFALDVSDSIDPEAADKALAYVVEATKALGADQRAALVVFAGRAQIVRGLERAPITRTPELEDLVFHRQRKESLSLRIQEIERNLAAADAPARLDEAKKKLDTLSATAAGLRVGETDLREALRLARSVLPEDARRRIVLCSDGNWTRGDPEFELAYLGRTGITLDVQVATRKEVPEVIAERLTAPAQAKIKEPIELELQVSSAVDKEVTLELFRDQFLLKTDKVKLAKGKNVVRVPKQELEEGFHEFAIRIKAEGDPTPENNTARAVVVVQGRPRVLLVEGKEQDARHLEQALRDEDIAVEVRPPVGFPQDLNDLLNYDVLILSDVPATDLVTAQLQMVKQYVRDFGGGLIMLGGEKSFGLGGYYRTPVEDALPVRMPIKKTIEKPNLALVCVIDRSGSMAGEKLQLAKEGAIAAVEVLKAKDQIGIVCFDSDADWVVELQAAANKEQIVNEVARVAVGGGTFIYSGVYRAYEALTQCNAKLKHCIVLTDGHTEGSREEHIDLVTRMSAEEITVSTVGIGEADQQLLQAMADAGNGEAYFTNDFGSIPQIFTKETLRASKSMLVEEPFTPKVQKADEPVLKGIDLADAPLLMGYVATTPRETARVVLTSDYGDPVLAIWNYGLGRSVAWTSDAKNRWASDWISWPSFPKFWAQIVRGVMATGSTAVLQQNASITVDRGEVKMTIDTRDRDGRFVDEVRPEIAIVAANGEQQKLDGALTAPGLFEARFPLETYGEFVRLRIENKLPSGEGVGHRNYAVVESFPPEYRAAAPDRGFLAHAARSGNGRLDGTVAQAFEFTGDPARGLRDLWRLCVLLAALLLPLDIALRRLS